MYENRFDLSDLFNFNMKFNTLRIKYCATHTEKEREREIACISLHIELLNQLLSSQ